MSDTAASDPSAADRDLIAGWCEAFRTSAHFARLADEHRNRAPGIIDLFAVYSRDYTGEAPGRWSAGGVRECCLEILPRKVTGDAALFEAVAPVLAAFFLHLDEQQHLKGGRALAGMVATLDRQIVANSRDRRNWGLAKSAFMQALDAGVDINNQREVNAHFLRMNASLLALRKERAVPQAEPAPAVPADTPPVPVRRAEAKVGRNDPCPCGSGKKYKKCCMDTA